MIKNFIIAALALAGMAHAQQATQGQQTAVDSAAQAIIAPGAVAITSNGASELPAKHITNESTGTTTVRTTGQAIAPGIYNSSGQYTCFGGVSFGIGVPGAAASGGSTVSQADCYRLHRMDKAAGRAGAAMKAAADPTVAPPARAQFAAQGEAFSKLWDAEYCAMDGGAAAFEAAGMQCPNETTKRAASEQRASQALTTSTDPFIAARLRGFVREQ